jgi:hypothetical protein
MIAVLSSCSVTLAIACVCCGLGELTSVGLLSSWFEVLVIDQFDVAKLDRETTDQLRMQSNRKSLNALRLIT